MATKDPQPKPIKIDTGGGGGAAAAKKEHPTASPATDQITLRNNLNIQLYSFPEEKWDDPKATTDFALKLKGIIDKLDLSQHQRLPYGARSAGVGGAFQLEGLIYEDIYDVILRLFKLSYLRSSLGGDGLKGSPANEQLAKTDRALVRELLLTLKKFVPLDPSLSMRIASFQKALLADSEKAKREAKEKAASPAPAIPGEGKGTPAKLPSVASPERSSAGPQRRRPLAAAAPFGEAQGEPELASKRLSSVGPALGARQLGDSLQPALNRAGAQLGTGGGDGPADVAASFTPIKVDWRQSDEARQPAGPLVKKDGQSVLDEGQVRKFIKQETSKLIQAQDLLRLQDALARDKQLGYDAEVFRAIIREEQAKQEKAVRDNFIGIDVATVRSIAREETLALKVREQAEVDSVLDAQDKVSAFSVRKLIKDETAFLTGEIDQLKEKQGDLVRYIDNARDLLGEKQRELFARLAKLQADGAAVVHACAQMPKQRDLDHTKRELVSRLEEHRFEQQELIRLMTERNQQNLVLVLDTHEELILKMERLRSAVTEAIDRTDEDIKILKADRLLRDDLNPMLQIGARELPALEAGVP